jgi:hypothetical protein
MSELQDKIKKDIIEALKNKDEEKVSTLRMLQAALQQKFIENKKEELKEEDVLQVLKKQVKQIQDSIEAFTKGNRQDLAKKEKASLEILNTYLPPQASADEIKEVVLKIKDEIKPQGPADFGKVMKEAMTALKGQADGKEVSLIVKQLLTDNK